MFPGLSSRRSFLQASLVWAGGSLGVRRLIAAEHQGVPWQPIACNGAYGGHLQGVCTDRDRHIFWSFTTHIVKTDSQGRVVKVVKAPSHQGDLCYREGKVYVAVNLGKFNEPAGSADSWVFVFDANTLEELSRHPVPEAVHGAGGMDACEGHFFVVGGLPADIDQNYVFEYDDQFRFQRKHVIPSGQTYRGIQTATYHDDCWWFGCYGQPAELLKTDRQFRLLGKWNFDCALGLTGVAPGQFLVGRGGKSDAGHSGKLLPARVDPRGQLVLAEINKR